MADMIRNQMAIKALETLKFTPKKAAKILYKVLQSAVSNATNNDGKKAETLIVKSIIVNRGTFYRRFLPSTRGRALPIHKPTANISIELDTIDS